MPTRPDSEPHLSRQRLSPRSTQLDVLRGIAILLVLGRHHVVSAADAGWLLPVAGVWQRFGWSGVDLFFVLSGFLIGGLLFSEIRQHGKLDAPRFIIRRGMRIWPAYYLYLLFLALPLRLDPVVISPYEDPFTLWPSVLHYQNYASVPRSHLWSLAVEEHVYLALPVLLIAVTAIKRLSWLPWILIALLGGALAGRCLTPMLLPFPWRTHVYPTHLRFDSILFGVLLAYAHHMVPGFRTWAQRNARQLMIAGIAMVLPMAFIKLETSWMIPTFGFTALYLGFGALLIGFVHTPLPAADAAAPAGRIVARFAGVLSAIGFYSYGIYLWHFDAAKLPMDHLLARGFLAGWPSEVRFLLATTLYVLAAVLAGRIATTLVDLPVLRLRDRLFPPRSRTNVAAAPSIPGDSVAPDTVPQLAPAKEVAA